MRTEIVVFGRQPVPGRVKTRLASAIGINGAAEVSRVLLDHALAAALATELPVTLAMTEASNTQCDWRPPEGLRIELQAEGDLGTRMRRAFEARFAAGAAAVVLTGSDLPHLTAELFRHAGERLARVPVVLGPAADGGYWLVGQRAPGFDLFSGVPWSSAETLLATRSRLSRLAVPHEELPLQRDLDTLADLEAVLADEHTDDNLRRGLSAALVQRPGRR